VFGRSSSWSRFVGVALTLCVMSVLGACNPFAPAASGGGQPQAVSGAGTLDRIIQSKQIRVGVVNDNPPYSYVDNTGNLVGYDIDIINMIAKDVGATPNLVRVDAPGRISGLQTGQLDMTVANFSITPARALVIDFSQPYLVTHFRLVVANDSPLKSLQDANQSSVSVATPRGATSTDQLQAVLPQAQLQVLGSIADVKQALSSGQATAAVFDDTAAPAFLESQPGKYKLLDGAFPGGDRIGIGVPKGDPEWARWIDLWVAQFNFSGQNAAEFQKWFHGPLPSLN
jgi:polar amino acid transport system substrate-binding protein